MFEDTYKTIASVSEGIYRDKGSKFIAIAIPVISETQIKDEIASIKKQYFDARHHCYAYILGPFKDSYRYNDDGEPSSTAGRPIYGQLLSKDLTNVLVVVVRYFGGVKLGVSGLINAYKEATKAALENAEITERIVTESHIVSVDYESVNKVMQILKADYIQITNQFYENQYCIEFSVRLREADRVITELKKITSVIVQCKK
ncbi:MAG TPA: YigZ family protein [Bacteroidales bacterium]|jgi:uncharacterized YigZ family protein|nr:YigZ family protein [Bacteroidales bacterium]HPS72009.1 YigZ family protein [Bacteroidales bacterium]